jgi:hypothetical protein
MNLTAIKNIVVHRVGNKIREEDIRFSHASLNLNEELKTLLLKYFLSPFNSVEYFNFSLEKELKNEVYESVSRIFNEPDELYEQSIILAKHLYAQSLHPKVKTGEFFVVYFEKCMTGNEEVDAIGLFKAENKEPFLKVYPKGDNFEIENHEGINIGKLEKGCLIFRTEKEKGYLVSLIDTTGRGSNAQYWKDDFLHLKPREDDYFHTKNVLNLCKSFVVEKLPEDFGVSKADQAIMLNRSVDYFKQNEVFEMDDFTEGVIQQPDVIEAFKEYKDHFEREKDIRFHDGFDISGPALKKQQRVFKSVIKLDKNFHIYVHGNREMIIRGVDEESGMHYYKLLYKDES